MKKAKKLNSKSKNIPRHSDGVLIDTTDYEIETTTVEKIVTNKQSLLRRRDSLQSNANILLAEIAEIDEIVQTMED